MDREQTGGERPKDEVDVRGIDKACLVPASRITDLPGVIGCCDDPAQPGDLIFGDVNTTITIRMPQPDFESGPLNMEQSATSKLGLRFTALRYF